MSPCPFLPPRQSCPILASAARHASSHRRPRRAKPVLPLTAFPRRNLIIDPKTRKVIVVENPLLSTRVKEMIARVLFDNLQVSRALLDEVFRPY